MKPQADFNQDQARGRQDKTVDLIDPSLIINELNVRPCARSYNFTPSLSIVWREIRIR
jgi:hypothetical protein